MRALVMGLAAFAIAAVAVPRAQFRGAVDVVEVTATVTDGRGRFLTGWRESDFTVREDGIAQRLIRAGSDREPVSLGLVLDASGSMQGERMSAARSAILRLLFERLDPRDELFFVEFGFNARLTQEWTSDRQLLRGALQDVQPTGDTALYDAVALAVPTAQTGRHRKKVLLVISDGGDTHSVMSIKELSDAIVASDVLVYALGFDKMGASRDGADPKRLRQITDATGGRTEMVRRPEQLTAAVDRIAEELGRQYQLAYERTGPRDGRRHEIRVEVETRGARVRARTGYVAD
jgi:Ca-activated chloride channel homolog